MGLKHKACMKELSSTDIGIESRFGKQGDEHENNSVEEQIGISDGFSGESSSSLGLSRRAGLY